MPHKPFIVSPLREDRFGRRLPAVQVEIVRGRVRRPLRIVKPPLFLLGAAADCDLVLGDPRFPQVHSYLLVNSDGVSFRHLGSAPEVVVGNRRVESAQLLDGDTIKTGPFEFKIRICDVLSNHRRGRDFAAGPLEDFAAGKRGIENFFPLDDSATWPNER